VTHNKRQKTHPIVGVPRTFILSGRPSVSSSQHGRSPCDVRDLAEPSAEAPAYHLVIKKLQKGLPVHRSNVCSRKKSVTGIRRSPVDSKKSAGSETTGVNGRQATPAVEGGKQPAGWPEINRVGVQGESRIHGGPDRLHRPAVKVRGGNEISILFGAHSGQPSGTES